MNRAPQGRSLELFLIDGKPDGMQTAAVVTGRQTNGTTAWRLQGFGKTYKQWEAESLEESVDASLE